jgi:DNA glycosylase AlkZ-like
MAATPPPPARLRWDQVMAWRGARHHLDERAPAKWSERSLVKTWAMRGTLHLLPGAELPLWQAARSTVRPWETGAWQRGFGVTLAELGRLNDAVAQALDGQLLTREELADRVAELTGSKRLGDKLRESWGALLKPAAGPTTTPFKARVYRPQGWLSPVLLVGGRMDGVWRQETKGRRVQVTIEPFAGPLPTRVRHAAEAEAERLVAWSGGQLELRWADG